MNRKMKNALLSLALAALMIPMVGCDYDIDKHAARGDWSSFFFDFVYEPGYSSYDTWDTYSYEEVYVEDSYSDSYYSDSYYSDSYYNDYEYYDDYGWSWKNKANGKRK